MKKKKAVIITNTVYQLIVAIQMKLTVLKDMEVDLFISDHSVGVEKYVATGKRTGIFKDIKYIKSREYTVREGKYKRLDKLSEISFSLKRFYEVIKRCRGLKTYDYMFAANIEPFTIAMFDTLSIFLNRNIRFYLFEDGLSTYKSFEASILQQSKDIKKGEFANIYKHTKYGCVLDKISGVFVFNPRLFEWKWNIKCYKIPKVNRLDDNTIRIMNIFFDYQNDKKIFENKKVIFFEESFYADGCNVNDVKLVKVISECIGKEHILIKLHPRNKENRFAGYDIFKDSSIPWEIIYLNNDLKNIELVSISSGSIIHPYVVFGERKKVVILQKLANISINGVLKIYQNYLREKIFEPNPEVFFMPEDEAALKQYFLEETYNESGSVSSNKIKQSETSA